jgi:tetratricopeptide (TPR) repeat protein
MSTSPSPFGADEWLTRAHQHEQAQAWAQAAQAYEQALALDPARVETHTDLGLVYEQLGQLEQAERHYRALTAERPDELARHHLGRLLQAQGRIQEAQIEFEARLELTRNPETIKQVQALLVALVGVKYEKCAGCGKISTLTSAFKKSGRGRLCPRCYARRQSRSSLVWILVSVAVVLVCAMTSGSALETSVYQLVNFALVVVLAYALIIPHELAHAGLTWLAGGRVFEIRIGTGQLVLDRSIGRLILSLGRFPASGYCMAAFSTRRLIRVRLLLVASAGMLFNLVMVLLFAPGFNIARWGTAVAWREALVFVNAVHLAANLWPRQVRLGNVETLSDGGRIWRILTGKQTAASIQMMYALNQAQYALRRRQYAEAERTAQAALAEHPNSTLLKNVRAVALLELGRPAEALVLFRELLNQFETGQSALEIGAAGINHEFIRAMLLNNVAYAAVLASPDADTLAQARDYARQAFRIVPWMPHMQGTWGAVLIATGEVKPGIAHLLEAEQHHELRKERAELLAHAARGYARLGDRAGAHAMLQRALALDSQGVMARRVQAEL